MPQSYCFSDFYIIALFTGIVLGMIRCSCVMVARVAQESVLAELIVLKRSLFIM